MCTHTYTYTCRLTLKRVYLQSCDIWTHFKSHDAPHMTIFGTPGVISYDGYLVHLALRGKRNNGTMLLYML